MRQPKECCGSKGPTCKKGCQSRNEPQESETLPPENPPAPVEKSDENTKSGENVVYLDGNKAIVMRGDAEVRSYDLDTHGERFKELADQFAKKLNDRAQ